MYKSVIVVDISGKVTKYDLALCDALSNTTTCKVVLFTPDVTSSSINEHIHIKKCLSLIPSKYKNSNSILKRSIKAIEGFLNYTLLFAFIVVNKVEIIHFQWLPFLEVCGIEKYFLKLYRLFNNNLQFILTVHNVFPHNSSPNQKNNYKNRFKLITPLIDTFIVHTETTKHDVSSIFNIPLNKINVIYHGIFTPDGIVTRKPVNVNNMRLIMYGNQSLYKGTDIFVKALSLLPDEAKGQIEVTICGKTDEAYFDSLTSIKTGINIKWIPHFLDDKDLYKLINESDMIILPYRAISQSGVLLLALYFNKLILTSDLPSFKETLDGFRDDMFFKSEDPESLKDLICSYIGNQERINTHLSLITSLQHKYSWSESAQKTNTIYYSIK